MRLSIIVALCAATALLNACDANFHSIFRTTPNGTGELHSQLVYSDAKQAVSFMQVGNDDVLRACAARSPDVFSALSTAFSGDVSAETAKLTAALSGAGTSAEQASAFGLRTQLTQSQMELLYQLCIASLNGTLSPDQFATEMHRYQNTMVTMLAIEQVTGYAKPTVVVIGGNAAAGSADALAATQAKIDDAAKKETAAKSALDKAGTDKKSAGTAYDEAVAALQKAKDDKKPEADIKVAQTKVDDADKAKKAADEAVAKADGDLKKATSYRESLEKLLASQQQDVNLSASSATPTVVSPAPTMDAAAIAAVAGTVEQLQYNHLSQTFIADECLRYLFHPNAVKDAPNLPPPPGTYPSMTEILNKSIGSTAKPVTNAPVPPTAAQLADLRTFCANYLTETANYRMAYLNRYYGCDNQGGQCKLPIVGTQKTNIIPGADASTGSTTIETPIAVMPQVGSGTPQVGSGMPQEPGIAGTPIVSQ